MHPSVSNIGSYYGVKDPVTASYANTLEWKSPKKVVIVMGATRMGKSKLYIDLADHFPIIVVNKDKIKVYKKNDISQPYIKTSIENELANRSMERLDLLVLLDPLQSPPYIFYERNHILLDL
ncbi:hypothetical protein H5410_061780 [Solanum commersonii]|uniref:Uncharacterized protein n=1 Tax=Solanum commersonii TaxID=4109 RepID=A0A9J5WAM7_SOLCO|nr:hypothetical protein H5410_061780 [Solanum commersonii]